MANTITPIVPKLLAQGLMALREQSIMPRLVNRTLEPLAGQKGSTIDVPIPSAVPVQDVTPGATATTGDITPTTTPVPLDKWKEAPFYLTDREMQEAMIGVIPMQASEAIKSLANQIDTDILANYVALYGYTGTAGTTPFASDLTAWTGGARRILNEQLAPMDDRRVVLDPLAEGNAINLRAFQDASFGGGQGVILRGQIGTKIGADWFMDQNLPTHTRGTISDGTNPQALINGAVSAGATTMNLDETTLTGTLVTGDVFTVANVTGTFVITGGPYTAAANAFTNVTFSPAAPTGGFADDAQITVVDTHTVNLAFHRDCFAFASRPFEDIDAESMGSIISAVADPVSGVALRLEVTREHKRMRFAYDVLYGSAVVRAELGARIAG